MAVSFATCLQLLGFGAAALLASLAAASPAKAGLVSITSAAAAALLLAIASPAPASSRMIAWLGIRFMQASSAACSSRVYLTV